MLFHCSVCYFIVLYICITCLMFVFCSVWLLFICSVPCYFIVCFVVLFFSSYLVFVFFVLVYWTLPPGANPIAVNNNNNNNNKIIMRRKTSVYAISVCKWCMENSMTYYINVIILDVLAEWLALLLCIHEVGVQILSRISWGFTWLSSVLPDICKCNTVKWATTAFRRPFRFIIQ
jgi:hypothetical protein